MKILSIQIASMAEVLNGTHIDQLIPNYTQDLIWSKQGKSLYLKLINNFSNQGYTHIQFENQPLSCISEYIEGCQQNYLIF